MSLQVGPATGIVFAQMIAVFCLIIWLFLVLQLCQTPLSNIVEVGSLELGRSHSIGIQGIFYV